MIVYVHNGPKYAAAMAVLEVPAGSTTVGDIMDAALPQLNVNVDGDFRLVVSGTKRDRTFEFSPHEAQRFVLIGADEEIDGAASYGSASPEDAT